jgi:dTDP-4-dehydrorhamnose reductase
MKILVIGSKGMLARDLIPILSKDHTCFGADLTDVDKTDITDIDSVARAVSGCSPDAVINCAAYTAVDLAETERDKAMLINGLGAQNVAVVCREKGVALCHIGTDYVFDGESKIPYTPFDNTNPINYYGVSKLAGEKYVRWACPDSCIVRTSWLYGRHGNNFVKTILKLASEREELRVVDDQFGNPTSAVSLSHGIKSIVESGRHGIYHFTDDTDCDVSWHRFAKEILRLSDIKIRLLPVTTAEFPRPAKRPKYSVLDLTATRLGFPFKPVRWEKALADYMAPGDLRAGDAGAGNLRV